MAGFFYSALWESRPVHGTNMAINHQPRDLAVIQRFALGRILG